MREEVHHMRNTSTWILATALVALLSSTALGQKAKKMASDNRPTAAFRTEHVTMLEHLGHVDAWVGALSTQPAAEQSQNAKKVVAFFEEDIKPHAAWEEKSLYPVVDRIAGSGAQPFTSTMRHEHRIVERWIGELRTELEKPKLDTKKFARRADNLLGLLRAHFEEEDEVLLPLIDKAMSKAEFEKAVGNPHAIH
jgi:hemerythrin-like domain-containing protein